MKSSTRRMLALLSAPLLAAFALRPAAAQAAVLEGRVFTADGGETRGLRVWIRADSAADSANVDEQGRFSATLPDGADSVTLLVDAADSAARRFHPARVELGPAALRQPPEIILVPLRWTIATGSYAGQTVEIDLARAFARPCATCSGFYRRSPGRARQGRMVLPAWPAERFPLRVAFDREWSGENVSARDSVLFWKQVQELEDAFGSDVFRPANYADTAPHGDGPGDVILVWFDPELHPLAGLGSAVSNDRAEIEYGDLRLDRAALEAYDATPGIVEHELMHTLGFGHTCAWRSVLADVRRCPELRAPTATAEDVAYVQLAARVRALQRERRDRWALEAAIAAEEHARPTLGAASAGGAWTGAARGERSASAVADGAGERL